MASLRSVFGFGVHSAHIDAFDHPAGATIAEMSDPASLRQVYLRGQLDEADLAGTWHEQLTAWFEAAAADPDVPEPNAIQLATVDAPGRPSVRTVLAKRIDERGIVFYTNYESAKARDLAGEPRAAA